MTFEHDVKALRRPPRLPRGVGSPERLTPIKAIGLHAEPVTQPPIVPGPPQPDEPTSWQQPVSGPPPQYYQQPVYYPPPQHAPGSLPPGGGTEVAKKAAIGTVTVIVTLVGLFCVLPMLVCFGMAACGAILPSSPAPSPLP